jgi:hypothetical protein
MKKILFLFVATLCCQAAALAADRFVSFEPQAGTLPLRTDAIDYNEQDYEGVLIAIGHLKADMAKALNGNGNEGLQLLIGTVGRNAEIDRMVKQGQLPDLKGRREKFIITTDEANKRLVIAGSDRRGTIYGIYELSEQLGVSPWYWWMDVPVAPHARAYVKSGVYTDGEPAVEFRGLFLNDEAPCLTTWVKNTWGTDYGDHRFYEKVFELILRLRGNMLWPAMWGWAFYADDPENGKTADRMGVIMGTSHHEPMARNHQEYARHRQEWGPWNYQTNQEKLDQFFREGIERMKGTEDMVTIGMRGDGDEAMSTDADTKLMERIINNQRRIIKEVTKKPAEKTTQVWALYKEVQDYYDAGLRVPDDVMILISDDNWGNIRRVPTAAERNRKGGWGIYYHVDYVGAPRNSKWLNVTPSQNMWEQLTLAYNYGIQRMWILNVGDLKPMEYPITLFMDMAWNPSSVSRDVIATHTKSFCAQQFGCDQADEAARLLNRVSKMNGRCTPEMLDARTYNVENGEWQQVADDYMRLETEALRQYLTLRPELRDAYQQLILFPVQAMSNLHQMYYAQAMNQKLAKAGAAEANIWADRVEQAFHRDSLLCAAYNNELSGGKWRGMMTQKHIGYRSWNDNFRRDIMPNIQRVNNTQPGGCIFQMSDGRVVMEAEHYYEAQNAQQASWTVLPDFGRTLSAMTLMPYTASVNGAAITYKWKGNVSDNGNLEVLVVTKSTLDYLNKGGLTFTVQIDGGEPQTVNFNAKLNEKPENVYSIYYPTVARRVVESRMQLKADTQLQEHTLTLCPQDPAIVFEKIVVSDAGKPAMRSYLFGNESDFAKVKQ